MTHVRSGRPSGLGRSEAQLELTHERTDSLRKSRMVWQKRTSARTGMHDNAGKAGLNRWGKGDLCSIEIKAVSLKRHRNPLFEEILEDLQKRRS